QELEAIEESFKPPFSRIPHYLANYVERRLPKELATQDLEPAQSSDVVVSSSGSLSHIYLNANTERMPLSQIAALYPTLVSSLLAHPGIWLVIGREAESTVILSEEGSLTTASGAGRESTRVEGRNPLWRVAYSAWAQRQLARLASLDQAGDLILIGAYDADTQRVSCFESQWACHGGLGGPQDMAMLMTESHIAWPLSSVERAAGIYSLFTRQYDIS
ncbi:MAG: hypothetical protein ACYCYF_10985, partial [Anaerolineae bacterium]